MAKFRPIHGELSGSIAGNTYSHNRGGQYVRQRRTPVNPATTRQTLMRSAMASMSRAFQALTSSQQTAWKLFGVQNPVLDRMGNTIVLSGISCFNKLNTVCRDMGLAAGSVPPVTPAPQAVSSFSAAWVGATGVLTLTFTPTPIGVSNRLQVWWTGPGLSSQDPNFAQARLIGYTAANAATGATITAPAAAQTGAVTNVFVCVVDSAGRTSAPVRYRVTAT